MWISSAFWLPSACGRPLTLPTGWREPEGITRTHGHARSPTEIARPPYVATARTLAALIQAIVEDNFLNADLSAMFRDFLLVRPGFSYGSYTLEGIEAAVARIDPGDPLEEFSKIGILWAMADFIHIVSGADRYSLVVLGLLPKKIGGVTIGSVARARALGDAVHTAINAAHP
jgi:hypothetical protein